MKSKLVKSLLRSLITLLGAGVGIALAMLAIQIIYYFGMAPMSFGMVAALYCTSAGVVGLIFYLLSPWMVRKCVEFSSAMERWLESMPPHQMLSATVGLICGLIIAALLTQMLQFMGDSVFTIAFSAIIYVVAGVTGLNIGHAAMERPAV